MEKKIMVALPCYNEAANIPALIKKFDLLNKALPKDIRVEVILIDDCSSDNTHDVVLHLKNSTPVHYINHPENLGLTGGMNTAFDKFAQLAPDPHYIAFGFMDGDNTQDPIAILEMYPHILDGHDVVIASRYHPHSHVFGVTQIRRCYSYVLACLFKLINNIPHVRDYSCGYRLYSPRLVLKLKKYFGTRIVYEKSFACAVELLLKAHKLGAICIEAPFNLHYEYKIGASKMPYLKTIFGNLKLLFTLKFKVNNTL